MALFDFLKPKKVSHRKINIEMRGYINGKEVPLSTKDDNSFETKPIEYYKTIEKEIKPLENKFVNLAASLKDAKLVDKRIEILSMMINQFYETKNKCKSFGSDYVEYFSEMWEHCHNSKNHDFNYIERYETELKELRANYNDLKAKENLHLSESKDLLPRVIAEIKKSPGVLQKDLYRLFDPIVKNDVRDILYRMEKDGIVTREKSGNTYKITYRGR